MKNHYRFLALMTSFVMVCAAPMSALCSEAAPAGETAAAAETETAEIEEPAAEGLAEEAEAVIEEAAEIEEEAVEETSNEVDIPDEDSADTEEEPAAGEEAAETAQPEEAEAEPVTEGYCGQELTWEYAGGVLGIRGTGEMYDYDEEQQPEWLVYAEEIRELRIEEGITLLDAEAFGCLTKLETIYFEGSEEEWKELEKEWEDPEYIEEKGEKEVFADVTEYSFGEEEAETPVEPEAEEPGTIEEETGEEQSKESSEGAEESLRIVTEPEDIIAEANERVAFEVEVNRTDVFYQWQYTKDGSTWNNCTSAGSDTDTFGFQMKGSMDGRKYRCLIYNDSDEVMTREASLTLEVHEALKITEQPESVTAPAGATVRMHVGTNKTDASYQWQWSRDGQSWSNCTSAGYDTDTFSFTMKETMNGRQYRCIVTSGSEQETSEAAVVTYGEELDITEQPQSVEAAKGDRVSFHVAANSADVTYQWQYTKDGSTWNNCTSACYNTDTFSFTMGSTMGGRKYRCVVTGGGVQKTSDAADLTLKVALKITEQPLSVEASRGEKVTFHVAANKTDVTYQWQYNKDGATWNNCTSRGYNKDTFSFTIGETMGDRQYRCVVTSGSETVTSEAAQLTIVTPVIVIDDVEYELIDDVMTVTGYRGSAETVVVQETVDGHTVTVIGESAFEGSSVRTIDLPDTIQVIKKRAFANCSNLTNMN